MGTSLLTADVSTLLAPRLHRAAEACSRLDEHGTLLAAAPGTMAAAFGQAAVESVHTRTVSYTHLTLPTILLV